MVGARFALDDPAGALQRIDGRGATGKGCPRALAEGDGQEVLGREDPLPAAAPPSATTAAETDSIVRAMSGQSPGAPHCALALGQLVDVQWRRPVLPRRPRNCTPMLATSVPDRV